MTRISVTDKLDSGEIVRDKDIGQVSLGAEPQEQVDDLRRYRLVERRHRLVQNDDLRLERKGTRDVDALPLTAGELVGIPPREESRRQSNLSKESLRHGARFRGAHAMHPWPEGDRYRRWVAAGSASRRCPGTPFGRVCGIPSPNIALGDPTSLPSSSTEPLSGWISPMSRRPVVDLPHPLRHDGQRLPLHRFEGDVLHRSDELGGTSEHPGTWPGTGARGRTPLRWPCPSLGAAECAAFGHLPLIRPSSYIHCARSPSLNRLKHIDVRKIIAPGRRRRAAAHRWPVAGCSA